MRKKSGSKAPAITTGRPIPTKRRVVVMFSMRPITCSMSIVISHDEDMPHSWSHDDKLSWFRRAARSMYAMNAMSKISRRMA